MRQRSVGNTMMRKGMRRGRAGIMLCQSARFYTEKELRDKGVAPGTLGRLRKEGLLRHKRIGRQYHYAPDDVDRVLGWPENVQPSGGAEPVDPDVADVVRKLTG